MVFFLLLRCFFKHFLEEFLQIGEDGAASGVKRTGDADGAAAKVEEVVQDQGCAYIAPRVFTSSILGVGELKIP